MECLAVFLKPGDPDKVPRTNSGACQKIGVLRKSTETANSLLRVGPGSVVASPVTAEFPLSLQTMN